MKRVTICTLWVLACSAAFAQKTSKKANSIKQADPIVDNVVSVDTAQVSGVTYTSAPMKMPNDFFSNGGLNMMDSMAPMMKTMTMAMMAAQTEYYKQPGKLVEIAKLTREYFNALMKEGFTSEQAMQIITASGLLPKAPSTEK